MKRPLYLLLVLSVAFLFFGFATYLILILNPAFNDFSFKVNAQLASNLGSAIAGLVGPLFSLTGILLIVATLIRQNYMFKIQQFETKYFELIKIHRDNVNNLNKLTSSRTLTGSQVLVEVHNELGAILSILDYLCENHHVKLDGINKGGMAYTILYFGIGERSDPILKNYFGRNYKVISASDVNWIINELQTQKRRDSYRFEGHQIRLGHYYRHLYQSVKYVDGQEYLSNSEKYAYIKTLRAQLTTFEQSLLFFNSLSVLGKNWKNFIEIYQLIKNLPPEFTFGIEPKQVYSRIRFEYEETGEQELPSRQQATQKKGDPT